MILKTLERCFNARIDKEMGNIGHTVKIRIQKAILIAIDNNITPKIKLAVMSINASSGPDATSVTAISESGERTRITALLKMYLGRIKHCMCRI